MKVSNRKYEIIAWGKEPKEGMVLVGFACDAALEGKDLKQEILELLKEKDVGYRKAVILFKEKGLPSFDEAKRVVNEIKKDFGRERNAQKVLKKKYVYAINRVFWTEEQNIPPKDPRYFKLNIIDLEKLDLNSYTNEDKSFNAEKFIRENLSEKDIAKLEKNRKRGLTHKENAPNDNISVDNEWHANKQ